MSGLRFRLLKLDRESDPLWDEINGIISEHVPAELHLRVNQVLDDIWHTGLMSGEEEAREVYGLLRARLPDHLTEIQAAFMQVFFAGSECDSDDWARWEAPLDEHTPLRLVGRGDVGDG